MTLLIRSKGSWHLFTISRNSLYQDSLYRSLGVYSIPKYYVVVPICKTYRYLAKSTRYYKTKPQYTDGSNLKWGTSPPGHYVFFSANKILILYYILWFFTMNQSWCYYQKIQPELDFGFFPHVTYNKYYTNLWKNTTNNIVFA